MRRERGLSSLNVTKGFFLVVGFAGLLGGGCAGEKPKDASQQATISGKATFDGTKPLPLDTSIVYFNKEMGSTLSGSVDATGSYSIRASERKVGIPAGRYQVAIRQKQTSSGPIQMADTTDYQNAMKQGGSPKKPGKQAESEIPQKYFSFDSTPIILEISPGPNTKNLNLADFEKK
jgi:hypothetical protein